MAERMTHDSCEGCRHNLGGGCCRINEEAECGAGTTREVDDCGRDAAARIPRQKILLCVH